MDSLILTRFAWTDMGVFGEMLVDGQRLFTVERPWLDNRPAVSCIPLGVYECAPRRFYRGGYDAIEVQGVPGRTYILFHRGNVASDVQGCIAVTSRLGALNGVWAGLNSRPAFELFMAHFNRRFTLAIRQYQPEIVT